MKERTITAILLFLSSYAPLGPILIVIDFQWSTKTFSHLFVDKVILFIAILSAAIPFMILRRIKGGEVFIVKEAKNRTGDLIGYALPYLVAFIGLKLDDVGSVIGFLMFLTLLCVLTIKTHALWINPMLALMNFKLYEATVQKEGAQPSVCFLLSNQILLIGSRCRIHHLTESQFYVTAYDIDGLAKSAEQSEAVVHPDQED